MKDPNKSDLSTVAPEILWLLRNKPRQTPKMMSLELDYNNATIKMALTPMNSLGLVKKIAHGLYEITELGEYVLHQIRSSEDVVQ